MTEIRIAFFDIDGTLVQLGKGMSETMRQTLLALQKKGIRICVATGRPPFRVPSFDGIVFDAYLTYNGSYCYDRKGHEILSHCIDHQDVLRILNNAAEVNRPCSIAGKDRLLSNGTDRNLYDYFVIAGQTPEVSDEFDAYLSHHEIYQIMCGCVKEEYDAVMKGVDGAVITTWWNRAVDIIPKGSGKDAGVKQILSYFGFRKEEAMAFGDGGNDIGMLESVGMGVAMGNATEDVKAAVPYVCAPVEEEGIYQFCRERHILWK